jgi:hypothetical protein
VRERTTVWAAALLCAIGCGPSARSGAETEGSTGDESEAGAARPGVASEEGADGAEPVAAGGVDERSGAATTSSETPIAGPHGPLLEDDLRRGILARLADPPFPTCRVSALSPALRRRSTHPADNDTLRRQVDMELPEGTVSAGRAGGRELAIYLSPRLDPRSDIGDLGYRVRIRGDYGEHDLAIGLATRRPLVLIHNPMVPLIEGGALQLEAELRPIDDASIDFRGLAGTGTLGEVDELLVRCELADLERDRDADGLTDIEEQRLITDAWDPDTDGDGVRDGEDRSPLGSAGPTTAADEVWVAAYRSVIRPAATDSLVVAVRSGSRLEVGGEPSGRLLVLREDELGLYQRRFGLRAPMVLAVTMRGEARAEVVVDTAWSEATYDGRRDASGTWTFAARVERRAGGRGVARGRPARPPE